MYVYGHKNGKSLPEVHKNMWSWDIKEVIVSMVSGKNEEGTV